MSEKQKVKTLGDKIAEANDPIRGKELAAAQRADHLRALEEEREGYKRTGKDVRVKAVDAEIKRLKGAPVGRQAPKLEDQTVAELQEHAAAESIDLEGATVKADIIKAIKAGKKIEA